MDLSARLAAIDESIAAAARRADRAASDITRIVVTKFHPAALIRDLHAAGVRDVGENRQQEFSAKSDDVADLTDLRWHFIGQAQTKKARAIRRSAAVVHSLDRDRLADALHRAADATPETPLLDVLIQINLTEDPGRGGVVPDDLERLAEHTLGLPSLALRGVMAVAPLDEEPARAFARLRGHAERLQALAPDATWMSAGMTADFAEAVAEGATHLRIGSAITGLRPEQG